MILGTIFRIIGFLEKHSLLVILAVVPTILVLLWYMPFIFGIVLIVTLLVFLLGTFDIKNIKKSIERTFIFLFLLGLLTSPLLIFSIKYKYRFNHPETIIDRNHPKVVKMTREFQEDYGYSAVNPEQFLYNLREYVYEKIPYSMEAFSLSAFPSTEEVVSGMTHDCRGRAIIGYSILKNLGYETDIVYNLGEHAWVRVYDGGSYLEILDIPGKYKNIPWVLFNEEEVKWNSPLRLLSNFLIHGEYIRSDSIEICTEYCTDVSASLLNFVKEVRRITGIDPIDLFPILPFLVPVYTSGIFIFFMSRERKFKKYVLMFLGATIIVIIIGLDIVISSRTLLPLPIILVSGLYLRVISWKFKIGHLQ